MRYLASNAACLTAMVCAAMTTLAAADAAPRGGGRIAQPKAEPGVCTNLRDDYEKASKTLALNSAKGIGDNSAVRATMREAEDNNTLEQARITMELMRSNDCKAPTAAPSAQRYMIQGMKCQNDLTRQAIKAMVGGGISSQGTPACDFSTWIAER